MPLDLLAVLDSVPGDPRLIIGLMMLAATVESGFGVGSVVPGETVVVVGSVALTAHRPVWVLVAIALVAVAASAGDHIGYLLGRRAGPAIARSSLARRGEGWGRAMSAARRQRLLTLVGARLLPGVRTLVAAACGAAEVRWPRFLLASGIGALLWSALWAGGGAIVGRRALDLVGSWLPALVVLWVVVVVGLALRRRAASATRR